MPRCASLIFYFAYMTIQLLDREVSANQLCRKGHYYCGDTLSRKGYASLFRAGLYECGEYGAVVLKTECPISCVHIEDHKQAIAGCLCVPGVHYCGEYLRNQFNWPPGQLVSSTLYKCDFHGKSASPVVHRCLDGICRANANGITQCRTAYDKPGCNVTTTNCTSESTNCTTSERSCEMEMSTCIPGRNYCGHQLTYHGFRNQQPRFLYKCLDGGMDVKEIRWCDGECAYEKKLAKCVKAKVVRSSGGRPQGTLYLVLLIMVSGFCL